MHRLLLEYHDPVVTKTGCPLQGDDGEKRDGSNELSTDDKHEGSQLSVERKLVKEQSQTNIEPLHTSHFLLKHSSLALLCLQCLR